MTHEEKIAQGKGLRGGKCYREACNNGGAFMFNDATGMYYCRKCAMRINEANKDYNDGKPLCHED